MKFQISLLILHPVLTTSYPPPCTDITHSACGDNDFFLETDAYNREGCHHICWGVGQKCKFFLFDKNSFARGNCRLFDVDFSSYIGRCNELAGPQVSPAGCDVLDPPDNTCQVHRGGECQFGVAEETHYLSSWQHCQASCKAMGQCKFWQFQREQNICHLFYSSERTCDWKFSPRMPVYEVCSSSCYFPDVYYWEAAGKGTFECPTAEKGTLEQGELCFYICDKPLGYYGGSLTCVAGKDGQGIFNESSWSPQTCK